MIVEVTKASQEQQDLAGADDDVTPEEQATQIKQKESEADISVIKQESTGRQISKKDDDQVLHESAK